MFPKSEFKVRVATYVWFNPLAETNDFKRFWFSSCSMYIILLSKKKTSNQVPILLKWQVNRQCQQGLQIHWPVGLNPFKLGSSNLDERCKTPCLISLLVFFGGWVGGGGGATDLDLKVKFDVKC